MKNALRIGLRAGIRTLSQNLAGGLSGVVIVGIAGDDLKATGTTLVIVTLGAILGGVVAFLMNFSENIPEEVVA